MSHRERIEFYLLIIAVFLLIIQVFIQQSELHEQKHINADNTIQIGILQNFTAKLNTTQILQEIELNLHKTESTIKVYKAQAKATNAVVDTKCLTQITSIKKDIATNNANINTNAKQLETFYAELTKAVAVNKQDINKVFNEAFNNADAIKVLDDNQGMLTKAVQYLEDNEKSATTSSTTKSAAKTSGTKSGSSTAKKSGSSTASKSGTKTTTSSKSTTVSPDDTEITKEEKTVVVDNSKVQVDNADIPNMQSGDFSSNMIQQAQEQNINLIFNHIDKTLAKHSEQGMGLDSQTITKYQTLLEQHGADKDTIEEFQNKVLEL